MPGRNFLLFLVILPTVAVGGPATCVADTAPDPPAALERIFAGAIGAVAGDVNADGRAGAADLSGALLGLRNPTDVGPYGVGVRRMTFVKRSETKPEDRSLDTNIWYPAPPGMGPTERRPGGIPDALLAEGVRRLPLLMFSHGSCGFQEQSIFLTPVIASYGFIVAAPPHPGNTIREILTCRTAESEADSFANRPADISFVIDELLALNEDEDSFFFDAIDPARIGVSGHSFGGMTTYRVSAMDGRVVAGLALAPGFDSSLTDEIASITVPIMVQGGTLDSYTRFEEDIRPSFELLAPPRQLVEIFRTGHHAFHDLCVGPPDCGPNTDTLTQEEAHLYVRRYAMPFLMQRLALDPRFDTFLLPESTPPGVEVTLDLGSGSGQ